MVAFLEKHFEFTTRLPMDVCVARLKAESKRKSGWLASKRDILVRILDDAEGKEFSLDRDAGQNLWAEVQGHLRKIDEHTIYVSGSGKISLFLFIVFLWFFAWSIILVYAFRNMTEMSIFFGASGIMPFTFLYLTLRNRNGLIRVVYQALDANE
ncbi:MAG: hypothetical protein GC179_02240 [Anaerolineaceae bacterium]|nr:hypothetical protein [Anaerolineaceae bacterium]